MLMYKPLRRLKLALIKDWHSHKHAPFVALLALLTILVVVAYYLNHPKAEPLADTWSYLDMVRNIETRGHLVDPWRLPGYPLLIVVVYTFAGQGNFAAVAVLQAILFVLTTLEIYLLAVLILRRSWIAFCIGLLVGPDPVLLSFIKPLMTEAFGFWLLTSLALALVAFIYTKRLRFLWLTAVCALLLFLTRPEWIYLPIPL